MKDCMMNGMMQGGMMGGMMALWGLLTFVLLIGLVMAVVLGVIWLVRRSTGSPGTSAEASRASNETPLEILKRRLAQGEITSEQFEAMKQQLKEG